ncbi:MAG: hypothetical protein ABSG65_04435 [Bryobacteraceae bacterium]|jgi:hypothetical protein
MMNPTSKRGAGTTEFGATADGMLRCDKFAWRGLAKTQLHRVAAAVWCWRRN